MLPGSVSRRVGRFVISEDGQDLAEYGLLVFFIAVAVVGAVTLLGENLDAYWRHLVDLWPPL